MRRLSLALVAALLATGCHHRGPQPTVNPFLGPTRVPPPGTGEAAAPSVSAPYYQSAPPPGAAPNYSTPQYQTPQQSPAYTIPGGSSSRNSTGSEGEKIAASEPALRAEGGVVRLDEAYGDSANVQTSHAQVGAKPVVTEPAPTIPTDGQPLVVERSPQPQPAPAAAPPAIAAAPRLGPPTTTTLVSQPGHARPANFQAIRPQPASPQAMPQQAPAVIQPAPSAAPLIAQPRQVVAPAAYLVPQTASVVYVQPGCDPCACQGAVYATSAGTEITDLPPAGARRAALESQRRTREVLEARSGEPTPADPPADAPSQPAAPARADSQFAQAGFQAAGSSAQGLMARYGYDTSYRWVRGRLEYSPAAGQWKLRYIPIDGDTDDYGGSVVIANPKALAGHEENEFVTLRGDVVSQNDPNSAFAPRYQIQRVEDLSATLASAG